MPVYHQTRNDEPCFQHEIYPRTVLTWPPYSRAIRLSRGTTKLNLKNYTPVHVANRSFVILHPPSSSLTTVHSPSLFAASDGFSRDKLATPTDCHCFRRCRIRISFLLFIPCFFFYFTFLPFVRLSLVF